MKNKLHALGICKRIVASLLFLFAFNTAFSQNPAFQISSTSGGFLAPSMTVTERNNIVSPVVGSLIYQNNSTPGYYYCTVSSASVGASTWVQLLAGDISASYIKNQSSQQTSANFNIDGAGILSSTSSQLTVGTTSAAAGYQLTLAPNSTVGGGISIAPSGASGTGLNISATSASFNGVLASNSSTSASAVFYGLGGILSATNIVSGYNAYRNSSGLSYGLYGVNGTSGSYATNANTWALFSQGRAVISSESSPTSGLGTDLEVRNTTAGAGNPVTVSLRQTQSNTTNTTVLSNINFGDNYTTTPQAQIQVQRDAAGGAADLPTNMIFSTTPDGSTTLTERMRIDNAGNIKISGLTASSPVFTDASKNLTNSGTLPVANGGSGQSTALTAGGIVYSSTTTAMASTAAGTSGQVLTSAGAGAPTWGGNGALSGITTYTTGSGTYTVPAGVTRILVMIVGGGGAGGSASNNCAGYYHAGSGGGAGGYCEGLNTSLAASYSYAVGAGGTTYSGTTCATNASPLYGGTGGATTFGAFTANGGVGGSNSVNGYGLVGGTGGTASGGSVNITGATGGYAVASSSMEGGEGAGSIFGTGGCGIRGFSNNLDGKAGVVPGSGGGGALAYSGTTWYRGGAGAAGIIIIYEYK